MTRSLPLLLLVLAGSAHAAPINFGRDVRPILSDRCFKCHGPNRDGQENELRLDTREEALETAIVPGHPENSEMIARITSDDPDVHMPPPDSGRKPVSPEELELIQQWIREEAPYSDHWAYLAPVKQSLPVVKQADWPANEVDRFTLARMEEHGLAPSPEADRRTLARRLSFDLVGLPPTSEQVQAFLADESPQAYERLVDRLLASEHYGERMALFWLDLVRYADSQGYHADKPIEVSSYRDYVINSFNHNRPFDQFTIEQLAGDLLPDATNEQKIASGYNRLLQTTEEGGAQEKEYMAIYQADRVRNVSSAWLGSTMGCCQCHDHKFDPFTTRDFYSLGAFFADLKEQYIHTQPPNLFLPTEQQTAAIQDLEQQLAAAKAVPLDETALNQWADEQREEIRKAGEEAPVEVQLAQDDVESGPTQESPTPVETKSDKPKPEKKPLSKKEQQELKEREELTAALKKPIDELTDEDRTLITSAFRKRSDAYKPIREKIEELEGQLKEANDSVLTMLVAEAAEPHTVRILPRGNWLDDSGEEVQPAIPARFGSLEITDRRPTRLDLAKWLVDRNNPLTARVFVNRVWHLFFGHGITRTLEDMGYQGDWPTHPELVDWLAVDFIDHGWDVKRLVRQIVTSKTYRQSSEATPALLERDPANRWLARQSRFRLDAEIVRDNALAVSGLLVDTVGGQSVKPYQPPGYWRHLNYPVREWKNDRGEGLYRRGLYTFRCRTFLHPSLQVFDAPTREECTADRPRSNTPLQALVLLNDPTYVEAARFLADRTLRESGDDQEKLNWVYEQVLQRTPEPSELDVLLPLLNQERERYADNSELASEVEANGAWTPPTETPACELAAWTAITRTLLNLHETVTRY